MSLAAPLSPTAAACLSDPPAAAAVWALLGIRLKRCGIGVIVPARRRLARLSAPVETANINRTRCRAELRPTTEHR